MEAYRLDTRLNRLSAEQSEALQRALSLYAEGREPREGDPVFGERLNFLLPMAELGLPSELLVKLMLGVPEGWPWDHSRIYYDFRLRKWMQHIEPATVSECLEEYFENSPSPESALTYLHGEWDRFLKRHS
jgi:hypothetical protein